MASSAARPSEAINGINVTPLVDVVLVLLLLLMVSASYTVSQSLPINLPQATSGEAQRPPLAISIDQKGQLYLDARPLLEEELGPRLRAMPELPPSALIAADARTEHQQVVRVIDILRQQDISQVALNVSPEELKQ